jgi:hypothetical protein
MWLVKVQEWCADGQLLVSAARLVLGCLLAMAGRTCRCCDCCCAGGRGQQRDLLRLLLGASCWLAF